MVMHPEHLKLHVIRGMLRTLNAEQFARKRLLSKPHAGETGRTSTFTSVYGVRTYPTTWSDLQGETSGSAAEISRLLSYRAQLLERQDTRKVPRDYAFTAMVTEVDKAVAELPPKVPAVPA